MQVLKYVGIRTSFHMDMGGGGAELTKNDHTVSPNGKRSSHKRVFSTVVTEMSPTSTSATLPVFKLLLY